MKIFKGEYQIQARGAAAFSSIIFFIMLGTASYHSLEDWTWIESFYFSVVTLTTVGYGDLTPTSDDTRLFTALFILLGVTVVVSAISFVGTGFINQNAKRREDKRGKKD